MKIKALCVFVMMAVGVTAARPAIANQPNIIIILTDDAGYADFDFTGEPEFSTPNIDALARSGMICTKAYVSASVCSPSRAGLLTGRYQQRFGHEFNLPGLSKPKAGGMPLAERTIASELRELGYHTGVIGKWHLGLDERFHPLNRGFDEFYGYLGGSRSYFSYTDPPRPANRAMRNHAFEPDPPDGYVTDTLGIEANGFIERNQEKAFFLYLSFTAVHGPMHAKEGDLAEFQDVEPDRRRKLAGMTAALDEAVGSVIETLERLELRDNTLIFFLNDNGGATNNASDNGVYRGMKGSKFEGGVRVPFAISWPGAIRAGSVFDDAVISLDILPTSVAAAGGVGDNPRWDGVDLVPFLADEREGVPHETLFWRRGVAAAAREGPWKLIRVESNPLMLFNTEDDPSESTNLASLHPGVADRLVRLLSEWEERLVEPVWGQDEVWANNQIRKHRAGVSTREQERRIP